MDFSKVFERGKSMFNTQLGAEHPGFLDLSLQNVVDMETRLKNGKVLLNENQCRDLSAKLSKTVRGIEELIAHSGKSNDSFGLALENLFRIFEKARLLVKSCCEDDWITEAVYHIGNDLHFQVILLEVGLCYHAISELAKDVNDARSSRHEDLRETSTFRAAINSEVRKDRDALRRRLVDLASSKQNNPKQSVQDLQQCDLARHLLVTWECMSQESPTMEFGLSSVILSTKEIELSGPWGEHHYLGRGGFGGVCRSTWLGIPCARKFLYPGVPEQSFLKEAGVLFHLNHPHVVKFFCCGYRQQEGDYFIAMELMQMSLEKLILDQGKRGTFFSHLTAIDIIVQIARAMCYLHGNRIVHRDLKPLNVVLNEVTSPHLPDHYIVKLVDFGLAKVKGEASNSDVSGPGIGTSRYRAPEAHPQAYPGEVNWYKADAYSFGVTCAHLLSLEEPFKNIDFRSKYVELRSGKLKPEVPTAIKLPEKLVALLNKCWDTNPRSRPSFEEICVELEEIRYDLLTLDQGGIEVNGEYIRDKVEEHCAVVRQHIVSTREVERVSDPIIAGGVENRDDKIMSDPSASKGSNLPSSDLVQSSSINEGIILLDSSGTDVSVYESTTCVEPWSSMDMVVDEDFDCAERAPASEMSEYHSVDNEVITQLGNRNKSDNGTSLCMDTFTDDRLRDEPNYPKWDDSYVVGSSKLCQVTRDTIMQIEPSMECGFCVFGYYGVGGIGKTTLCKTLCNDLDTDFSGKVCHIELEGTRSVEQILKEVLKKLTNTSATLLPRLDVGECQEILKNPSSWRQKTFLAIDSVWDDSKSMHPAKMFLKGPGFCEGSIVMVTSRSRSTLMSLGIHESHCFEVPELGTVDARKLFLHHAAYGKEFDVEDNQVIEQCLARCRFRKSETRGFHYLPLAVKVLGVHLRYLGDKPTDWLKGLPKVRDFNLFREEKFVFDIIRLNYDRLSVQLQALFMDVALFKPSRDSADDLEYDYFNWLSLVHRQKLQDTQSQLQQLKKRGLVEDVDMDSGRVSMHNLYKEFAKMEAEGKLNRSVGFKSRRWVYSRGSYPSDLERTPFDRRWENLIRVDIELWDEDSGAVFNLHVIQLRYCSNLVVLKLGVGVKTVGVLNLEGLRCLRSLWIWGLDGSDGMVEGVEDLNNLRYFRWDGGSENEFHRSSSLGQLPTSLEILYLYGLDVCLRNDVFDHCRNLRLLSLNDTRASDSMDFKQCSSLQSIYLARIPGLQKLLGLATGLQSCLRSLKLRGCGDLSDVSGLGDLVRLDRLVVYDNPLLEELPNLQKLSSLQFLEIGGFSSDTWKGCIAEVRGLGGLCQLRELHCNGLDATELPNLSTLEHLHVLDLRGCKKLTTLEGVAGLMALRHVCLFGCLSFLRLPDLSNSTRLESLELELSGIELHEDDMDMLAALPGLRRVTIGWRMQLDPVRRKVVKWKDGGGRKVEAERILKLLPIKCRSYEF